MYSNIFENIIRLQNIGDFINTQSFYEISLINSVMLFNSLCEILLVHSMMKIYKINDNKLYYNIPILNIIGLAKIKSKLENESWKWLNGIYIILESLHIYFFITLLINREIIYLINFIAYTVVYGILSFKYIDKLLRSIRNNVKFVIKLITIGAYSIYPLKGIVSLIIFLIIYIEYFDNTKNKNDNGIKGI